VPDLWVILRRHPSRSSRALTVERRLLVCQDRVVPTIDEDRDTFRRHVTLLPNYPEGFADVLVESAQVDIWAFFLGIGSVARGDPKPTSDIDVYAELAAGSQSRNKITAFQERMAPYGVHFVMFPDGLTLEQLLQIDHPFGTKILREALVLHDPTGTMVRLRAQYPADAQPAR
jgi:predicted nucleotidyltransferase